MTSLYESDQQVEVETWPEMAQIPQPWELAPPLVELGYEPVNLAELKMIFGDHLGQVLDWVRWITMSSSLIDQIGQATRRISDVVQALKSYSYMDQAPIQSIDVQTGLEATLAMLQSRLAVGIHVHRQYSDGLPMIQAYGTELNQVWTNLLDNALEVLNGTGNIALLPRGLDTRLWR